MATALAKNDKATQIEQVVVQGDLKSLSPSDRVIYYKQVCESMGLNPLTKPFDYITLNGKLTLYARKDCAEQLRRRDNVSLSIVKTDRLEDVYVVTARATTPDGRCDESTGAVNLGALKGEALANAVMKAETKAKRRVTLSICGLGWLDETEIETIPDAETPTVDMETGEIQELDEPTCPGDGLECTGCMRQITAAMRDYSIRAHGRPLCPDCQREDKANQPKPEIRNPDEPATVSQIGLLAKLFAERGYTARKEDSWLNEHFQVDSKKQLTKGQASGAIDLLMQEPIDVDQGFGFDEDDADPCPEEE